MRQTPSLVSSYLFLMLNKLLYAESFYEQVRAIEGLAAVLHQLGDEKALNILKEAVKFEEEAFLLDIMVRELREDMIEGNAAEFPENVKKEIVRLRLAIEKFKSKLLVELDEKIKGKVPIVWGDINGKR